MSISDWLWKFALETVEKYKMDDSHGMRHFVNTALYVKLILEDFKDQTIISGYTKSRENEIITDAAFSHDLIDSKYMDENKGIEYLSAEFKRNGYNDVDLNIVLKIITTMSFSKRIKRLRMNLPAIEPGPYTLATEIVTDADQLDGFDPERCRIYQERKFPHSKTLSRGWRKTILVKRVLLYKDVFMTTSLGKKLAEPLHNQVLEHVARELADAEMYEY